MILRLLTLSAVLGAVILALRLCRPFLEKHIAAKWRLAIWIIISVRLMLPFDLIPARVEVNIPDVQLTVSEETAALKYSPGRRRI